MSVYTPDRWVVVDLSGPDSSISKVFAGWYGGYLGGDSWKLSSGIMKVTEEDNRYEFLNESGSLYICYKNAHGMGGYMSSIYHNWASQMTDEIKIKLSESYVK